MGRRWETGIVGFFVEVGFELIFKRVERVLVVDVPEGWGSNGKDFVPQGTVLSTCTFSN